MEDEFRIARRPVPSAALAVRPPLRPVKSATHLRPTEETLIPPLPLRHTTSSSNLSSTSTSTSFRSLASEASFHLSGLVHHPFTSTRHHSIIAHANLIWYKGPSTSITITILSDAPLPPTRTIWLQRKGYSGNVGMSLKSRLGSRGIEVTPQTEAAISALSDADERGIQRDLTRFAKKSAHVPRETCVVRIPAAVSDGYVRLVLCDQGKVVLGSPVFRIASTRTDMAVVKGAGLLMPLELGVKVASRVGEGVVRGYAGVAGQVVQSKVSLPVRTAANVAYSGVGDKAGDIWRSARQDAGSTKGLPLRFKGDVASCDGSVKLAHVPAEIKALTGVYAAWARIRDNWHEAVVTIAPTPGLVLKNVVAMFLAVGVEDLASLEVLLMAYLHPPLPPSLDEATQREVDLLDTHTLLAEGSAQDALWHIDDQKGQQDFSRRVGGAMQRQVDRVPLHKIGVRTNSGLAKDEAYGAGGIYIPR